MIMIAGFQFRRAGRLVVRLLLVLMLLSGCSTVRQQPRPLPPVLTGDQIARPYEMVGKVAVRRERYGAPKDLCPADIEWAEQALRTEAARFDADGIVFVEIRSQNSSFMLFPTSEIIAQATVIRFR